VFIFGSFEQTPTHTHGAGPGENRESILGGPGSDGDFFYIWPFLKNQEMNPTEIYLQDLAPSGWASLVGVTRE
jgi:hypothetical protein